MYMNVLHLIMHGCVSPQQQKEINIGKFQFNMAIFQIIKRLGNATHQILPYVKNTKTFMVANCLSFLATLFLPLIAIDKVAKQR